MKENENNEAKQKELESMDSVIVKKLTHGLYTETELVEEIRKIIQSEPTANNSMDIRIALDMPRVISIGLFPRIVCFMPIHAIFPRLI